MSVTCIHDHSEASVRERGDLPYLPRSPLQRLRVNAKRQYDPTHTLGLRRSFVADFTRRFRLLRALVWDALVTKDVLGLGEVQGPQLRIQAESGLPYRAYEFRTSAVKAEEFMRWLNQMEERHLFELIRRPGTTLAASSEGLWSDYYIWTSYQKGIARGRSELKAAGVDTPDFGLVSGQPFTNPFNMPIHAERLALLFTRNFQDLKGIDAAMDAQISRILAQGLAEGRNPRVIARLINDRIDKIGLSRARTLARTEIIRAHHMATIAEYRAGGVAQVVTIAEWETAGDARVCPDCDRMEGRRFELDYIEGLIPLHPN